MNKVHFCQSIPLPTKIGGSLAREWLVKMIFFKNKGGHKIQILPWSQNFMKIGAKIATQEDESGKNPKNGPYKTFFSQKSPRILNFKTSSWILTFLECFGQYQYIGTLILSHVCHVFNILRSIFNLRSFCPLPYFGTQQRGHMDSNLFLLFLGALFIWLFYAYRDGHLW